MNFEVFTTSVELQDIPSYATNITLEGQTLRLSFLWNERLSKRVLSVKSSTDVTYLQSTILHPNESFELNSNAVFDDLPYSVTLVKTGDVNKVGNIFNWSKDFVLCFSRTVDVETEKLNVKYGVTKASTPTLPTPFGLWIVDEEVRVFGDNINYTAYKTNDLQYYDSFADFDLSTALLRSFHDTDMQGWQGFVDATNELTGTTSWIVDVPNQRVTYKLIIGGNNEYFYRLPTIDDTTDGDTACTNYLVQAGATASFEHAYITIDSGRDFTCYIRRKSDSEIIRNLSGVYYLNENYQPPVEINIHVSFLKIAQKIISNASSSNQIISLLADVYIEEVVNSIFNNDPSKQFIKVSDLNSQLEANKVLR